MAQQREFGVPVIRAATAAAVGPLRALRIPAAIPGAGSLLQSGTDRYERAVDVRDTAMLGAAR